MIFDVADHGEAIELAARIPAARLNGKSRSGRSWNGHIDQIDAASSRALHGRMTPIRATTDIARPAGEAFAYIIDPRTMPEWQHGCIRGQLDTSETHVGSKCTTVRQIGNRERAITTQITEYDPPRRWADHGIDGPIRAAVTVTVEPLPDPAWSRVTIEVDFTGHGIGKLLVPLIVRPQAAKEMPDNLKRLKQRLETEP
jgi:uncharacterized protein YndB with AHSA1/START domain